MQMGHAKASMPDVKDKEGASLCGEAYALQDVTAILAAVNSWPHSPWRNRDSDTDAMEEDCTPMPAVPQHIVVTDDVQVQQAASSSKDGAPLV